MTPNRTRTLLMHGSLLSGILLTLFPLPNWATMLRPDFVALIIVFWCIQLPNALSLATCFFYGLLLDSAMGTLLGQHGLGLTLVAYIAIKNYGRLRLFPLVQQGVVIMIILFIKQIIFLWIYGITNRGPDSIWVYFLPSIVSMAFWPWFFVLMHNLQRRFMVQ